MPIHESESSLPSQPASAQFHSSPPIFDPNQIFGPMESHQEVKLDPDTGVGDGHTHTRASSADTERPPNSAQRIANQDEIGEPADGNHEEAIEEEEEEDPADKIADFDWDGLHERYHAAIDKCAENETKLMQEFESLMNFFKVWADSGHTHETNRTYSRLRTRMSHVQNSEESLEKQRQHYIDVVNAFQRALDLLRGQVG